MTQCLADEPSVKVALNATSQDAASALAHADMLMCCLCNSPCAHWASLCFEYQGVGVEPDVIAEPLYSPNSIMI